MPKIKLPSVDLPLPRDKDLLSAQIVHLLYTYYHKYNLSKDRLQDRYLICMMAYCYCNMDKNGEIEINEGTHENMLLWLQSENSNSVIHVLMEYGVI